jgi:hypothetical protein
MSADLFVLVPPPQTIETLDVWGPLDRLPYSLDSVVWETAGVYGLKVSVQIASGGDVRGGKRIRTLAANGSITVGGDAYGEKAAAIRELKADLTGHVGGSLSLARVRRIAAVAAAVTSGAVDVGRTLHLQMVGAIDCGGTVQFDYKGWNWGEKERPSAPLWEQKEALPYPWRQKTANAAEWAAQGVAAQGWTQKHGGAAQWR